MYVTFANSKGRRRVEKTFGCGVLKFGSVSKVIRMPNELQGKRTITELYETTQVIGVSKSLKMPFKLARE